MGRDTALWAKQHAEDLLAPLGDRWLHSKAVGDKAADIAGRLTLPERDVLAAAGYLHDIGYAPELALTHFHPLDGGRHLRTLGHERLASLVAFHSDAAEQAELRGLTEALEDLRREGSLIARVLDYCDMTTGPDGTAMAPARRLADVEARYGPGHVVATGLRRAWPRLSRGIAEVDKLLLAHPQCHSWPTT